MPLRPFAVCSDVKVGAQADRGHERRRPGRARDHQRRQAARTDDRSVRPSPESMTVIFSTYQSIQAVAEAQTSTGSASSTW